MGSFIMIFLYISIALLGIYLAVTLFNIFAGPSLLKAPRRELTPKVSLLIPARNEERNIKNCLSGLVAQDYPDLEIIVLNDQSTDSTGEIVQQFARQYPYVKYMAGEALPEGWVGKNWACHQISRQASGEILIFTDADTLHSPDAVSKTVAWIERLQLGLFSTFPQQITKTLAEKLVIPMVDIFVHSSLPLWLAYHTRSPLFAAANGQWIAFTRTAYESMGGHAAVRNQVVEDVELSRLTKRRGFKTLVTPGTGVVFCRMYHSTAEVWEGLTKNLFGITGYNYFAFASVIFILLTAFLLPYAVILFPAFTKPAIAALGMNFLLRGLLAVRYKHPFWSSVLLHPIGVLFTIVIATNSFARTLKGTVFWKGREIIISKQARKSASKHAEHKSLENQAE